MTAIFTDVIIHPLIGALHVYWDDRRKIREVNHGKGSRFDIMAIPGRFEDNIPEVYEYLINFGNYETPNFSFDCLDISDFTAFTRKVYETLFNIPKGVVVTYGELALMAGYPNAYRAVGSAMRKNRFLLLVPCHRVTAADSLGGFITGMDTKIKLLEFEGVNLPWLKEV